MLKMGCLFLFHLFILCLMAVTDAGAGQESIELINLCETSDDILQASSHTDLPLAVLVSPSDLNGVSSSILLAESWVRSNVLAHYPAAKITTIIVNSDFCQQHESHLGLPSLKNVYHSLKRWGLEKEIKVSVAFYVNCLPLNSFSYDGDLKMVIEYLQSVNSTYSLIPHSDESLSLVSSHLDNMKKLGFSYLNNINVITIPPNGKKTIARKLSVVDSSLIGPLPFRQTPLSEIAEPPLHQNAHEPVSPTPKPSNFAPKLSPFAAPAGSPHGSTLPPCNPTEGHSSLKSWCVAKPSVPAVKLQQAMEYACGEGGADCQEIMPMGKCYNPDTMVAHASYAFNSYWQKHKRNGGTCNFGGTAMLINSDPSFLHCRFLS